MAVFSLPVDQRVIDIDSRRFASIEKALVELVTNSDDSYVRLERQGQPVSGAIRITYERHQNGAVLTVSDQAEGMPFARIRSILSYGGAHSSLARGESSGRGYFGRGLKQAIYGLGHGWIESLHQGQFARVDLYRTVEGGYLYDDWDMDRPAAGRDYQRLAVPEGGSGSKVTIVVENPQANIPYFSSLIKAVGNNIYLRDLLRRRRVELVNLSPGGKKNAAVVLSYPEPEGELLIGPDSRGTFLWQEREYEFFLTLKRSENAELVLSGDERTNGLLVIAGTAVLDCQFFRYENQLGTEFLFGRLRCDSLASMLAQGQPVISDEREGLNLKNPFVLAMADAVCQRIAGDVEAELHRLSHLEHATTSRRTQVLIGHVLQRMNQIAAEDLGIVLPPGPGSGRYGPYPTGRPAVLRFSTPFYYRQVGHPFHVAMIADRGQFLAEETLQFVYQLPESITVEPRRETIAVADLPADGRLEWTVNGREIGAKGRIGVRAEPYEAFCEVVIAEHQTGQSFGHPSGRPTAPWGMDNSVDLFLGYEMRSLNNEIDRAVYSPEERMILINTDAPTVKLYVNGQGHFKDGARLLLAELFLDVISEELARRYVDRTSHKGEGQAYHQAKQDMVRRYGVEVHTILLGG